MPFARIELYRGKSEEYLDTLSEVVNEALALLGSPPDDYFQIITQHEPGALRFHRTFRVEGGEARSDDFMFITVALALEHDEKRSEAFYRKLVQLLEERVGVRPADVFVMMQSSPLWYWSFANGVPLRLTQPVNFPAV